MVQATLLVLFPALMAYAAASDLLTMTIPNKLSLALVAGFVVLAVVARMPAESILLHAGAGALVLLVSFAFFAFGWIGGGDAKLAAATALWLGFDPLPDYLMTSAIGGGALTVAILVLRRMPLPDAARSWGWLSRLHDRGSGVPYGIALAGAALVVYPHSAIWLGAAGSAP